MPEFTGERVVPGLVDADLFNEHLARYEFALRFVAGKRVLDAGCGSGYGSAALARKAKAVTAFDASQDAIEFARAHFPEPNIEFAIGNCSSFPAGPFDVVVAFEVIEHLEGWRQFLHESRRALAPGGCFLVSTPNKSSYAESRGKAGSNPFHVHEFTYEEFRAELKFVFPNVELFFQNHVGGVAFTPVCSGGVRFSVGSLAPNPEDAHFFLAVCAAEPMAPSDAFIWIPGTGNVLREREQHIGLLTEEIKRKDADLAARNQEYGELLQMFRESKRQVEERNSWAMAAGEEARAKTERIVDLQAELAREQANFAEVAAGYRAKVEELEATNRAKTEWALETERRLTDELAAQSAELARCVLFLDRTEQTVIERTVWAQSLQRELEELQAQTMALRSRSWVKVGSKFGFVPQKP